MTKAANYLSLNHNYLGEANSLLEKGIRFWPGDLPRGSRAKSDVYCSHQRGKCQVAWSTAQVGNGNGRSTQ